VPISTLVDKVNSNEIDIKKMCNTRLSRKPVLPCNLEKLGRCCLMMERKFFGLTTRIITRMAFELAIKWSCPSIVGTTRNSRLEAAA
jgi:hypothetical protein